MPRPRSKYHHKHKYPKKRPSPPHQSPFDRKVIINTGLFFTLMIAAAIYLTPGG